MAKLYQVRYQHGEEMAANEHETEKGAKTDAKALSKTLGTASLGEFEVGEDGKRTLLRSWVYKGGKTDKPTEYAPDYVPPAELSNVNIVKTAEDTKLPEPTVKVKEKS